jgi:peptidoglycan/xylan/chitin deacetylase (PgdA/CDA1 family)
VNISITFDVEIWCNGWKNLDDEFAAAFQRYIFGADSNGYALPKTLEILNKNGLKGVFFVETLFAYRFGIERLQTIVDLITDAGHEIQLHIHPEWVDEADPPLISDTARKRQHLHQYSLDEQISLIKKGVEALGKCGAEKPSAFRAGSYGCNLDTLHAVAVNQIAVDSSVNIASPNTMLDASLGSRNFQPKYFADVLEYPVTVFRDGVGIQRHWQVASTGYRESLALIKQARKLGYQHLVLVSHSFEMLIPGSVRPDWIAVRRFEKLCRWLAANRDDFPVTGLPLTTTKFAQPKSNLRLSFPPTAARLFAQGLRRVIASLPSANSI